MNRSRLYAESVTDQNLSNLTDHLRDLIGHDPDFLMTLTKITHMPSTDAARVILRMPKPHQKMLLEYLIPAARVGLSLGMFAMEDKYSDPESESP